MNPIFISSYNVDFRDYDSLLSWIGGYSRTQLGAELAGNWFSDDYIPRLEENLPRFQELPVTIHGPFIEMCTQPGSDAETAVNRELEWCCQLYHKANAQSIVLHTHLRSGADRDAARRRVKEFLQCWISRMLAEGIDVTVENVGYPASGSDLFPRDEFLRLFDALPPETGCLIDTGHGFLNGWDLEDLICTMGTKIRGYHLNTNDGLGDKHFSIFDSRSVLSRAQMESLIRAIGKHTPDAHVILEYAPHWGITRDILYSDLDTILNLI